MGIILFTVFILIIITQRILELFVAKRNEIWIKSQGGIEYGRSHYHYLVIMHSLFFLVYIIEVLFFNLKLSPGWHLLGSIFVLTQVGRIWVITSLGKFWNTKIIVLPHAEVVKKGPYRYLKHPNYTIVTIEFIIIPLLFQAYLTAILFTLLNIMILSVRIPAEEKALGKQTEYEKVFTNRKRFVPNIFKKV